MSLFIIDKMLPGYRVSRFVNDWDELVNTVLRILSMVASPNCPRMEGTKWLRLVEVSPAKPNGFCLELQIADPLLLLSGSS